MSKPKKVTYITPIGDAVWPKLDKVDVYQPKKGEAKIRYTINIRFDPETEAKVRADLEAFAEKFGNDVGENENSPWKEDKKDGKKQGTFTLFAFSGKDYKPAVFDAKNRRLPDNIIVGGGSKVRLDVTVNPYDGFGGGMNLYINSVQVIDLVEGGQSRSRFDEIEDGYEAPEQETEQEGFGKSASKSTSQDDEIPF